MAFAAYTLCALTAAGCAFLLLLAHRRTRVRLLLWSGLCFSLLACNNALIAVDLVILPGLNLFLVRNVVALGGMVLMLYGLVWDAR